MIDSRFKLCHLANVSGIWNVGFSTARIGLISEFFSNKAKYFIEQIILSDISNLLRQQRECIKEKLYKNLIL
jgi:hypothetical protein